MYSLLLPVLVKSNGRDSCFKYVHDTFDQKQCRVITVIPNSHT